MHLYETPFVWCHSLQLVIWNIFVGCQYPVEVLVYIPFASSIIRPCGAELIRQKGSPSGTSTIMWLKVAGIASFVSVLPDSSGKVRMTSIVSSASERSSAAVPGGIWKSERLIVLELWVGPNNLAKATSRAVFPEPFPPTRAVMSAERSIVTALSPKHLKLRSVSDLTFIAQATST